MRTLETSRLRLRPVLIDHIDILHKMWVDRDVRRFLWDDVVISRDTAASGVEQTVSDWSNQGYGLWLIIESESRVAIGFVGFRSSHNVKEPELLFGLLPGYWHRGIATEAAVAALQFLFDEVGGSAAWAAVDPPNTASIRVIERTGMTFDRRDNSDERDTIFYRITAEQFKRVRVGSRKRRRPTTR